MDKMPVEDSPAISHGGNRAASSAPSADSKSGTSVPGESPNPEGTSAIQGSNSKSKPGLQKLSDASSPAPPASPTQSRSAPVSGSSGEIGLKYSPSKNPSAGEAIVKSPGHSPAPQEQHLSTRDMRATDGPSAQERASPSLSSPSSDAAVPSSEVPLLPSTEPSRPFGGAKKVVRRTIPIVATSRSRHSHLIKNPRGQAMTYINGKHQSRNGSLSSINSSLDAARGAVDSGQTSPSKATQLQPQPKNILILNSPRAMVTKQTPLRKSEGNRRAPVSTTLEKIPDTRAEVENKAAVGFPASASPQSANTSQEQSNQTKEMLALLNGNIAKLIAYVQPTIRTMGVSTVGQDDPRIADSNPSQTQNDDSAALEKADTSANASAHQSAEKTVENKSPADKTRAYESGEAENGAETETSHNAASLGGAKPSERLEQAPDSQKSKKVDSDSGQKNVPASDKSTVDELIEGWKCGISGGDSPPKPRTKYNTRRSKAGRETNPTAGRFSFRFPENEYVSDISSDESEEEPSCSDYSSSSWASEDDSFGYNRRKKLKRPAEQKANPNDGAKRKWDNGRTAQGVKIDDSAKVDSKADEKADVGSKEDVDVVSMDETVATVRIGDRDFSYKKVRPADDARRSQPSYAERYFVVSESADAPDWKKTPPPMPQSLDSLMKGMHSFFDDFISKMDEMQLAFKEQFAGKKDVITLANDWFLMLIDRLNMFPSVIVSELTRLVETSRQFFAREAEKAIQENKKTRWCAGCWEPAKFHCCFYAAYCSSKCQTKDWTKHRSACAQKQCSMADPNLKLNQLLTQRLRRTNNGVITISDLERFLDAEHAKKEIVKKAPAQKQIIKPLFPKAVSTNPSPNLKSYLPPGKSTVALATNKVAPKFATKLALPKPTFTTAAPAAPPEIATPADATETTPTYIAESLDGICVVEPEGAPSGSNSDDDDRETNARGLKRKSCPVDYRLSETYAKEIRADKGEFADSDDSLSFSPHFLEGFGGTASADSKNSKPSLSEQSEAPPLANVKQLLNGMGVDAGAVKPLLVKVVTSASGETQLFQMDESEVAANPKLHTMAAGWIPVSQSVKSSGSVVLSPKDKLTTSRTAQRTTTATTASAKAKAPHARAQAAPPFAKRQSAPRGRRKRPSMPNLTPIVKKETATVRIIDDPTLERILNSDNLLMNAFESSFYKNTKIRE